MIASANLAPPPTDEDAPPWLDPRTSAPGADKTPMTAKDGSEASGRFGRDATRAYTAATLRDEIAALSAKAAASRSAEWSAPEPLHRPLTEADPYPVEAFGPLAGVVRAIASLAQAPLSLAGQSVLGAASLAVQGLADVTMPTGESRPCSLFLLSIMESGGRKSTCDRLAIQGIEEFEREDVERYAGELREHRFAKDAWQAARKKAIDTRRGGGPTSSQAAAIRRDLELLGPEPAAPMRPGATTTAPTAEGLQKRLAEGRPSLGLFSAEAGSFTAGHAMNDDSRRRTGAVLSELWDNKNHDRDRVSEIGIRIFGKRLSLHLMATPGVAADFLARGDLSDQGLFSRMLVAAPASLVGLRLFREPDPAAQHEVEGFRARILELMRQPLPLRAAEGTSNRELDPPRLALSEEARAAWRDFHDDLERAMGPGGSLHVARDRVNKAPENVARVAGVLALAADSSAVTIGAEAMAGAVALVSWHVGEMLRLAEGGLLDPAIRQAEDLRRWLLEGWAARPEARTPSELQPMAPPGTVAVVTLRDCYTLGPSELRTRAQAEAAVVLLAAHGWLVEAPAADPRPGGGRRPGARYFVREATEANDGMA